MIELRIIGRVSSPLRDPHDAPKQGEERSPLADLLFDASVEEALSDVRVGDRLLVLTWLDRADRGTLRVHPRDDVTKPLRGRSKASSNNQRVISRTLLCRTSPPGWIDTGPT